MDTVEHFKTSGIPEQIEAADTFLSIYHGPGFTYSEGDWVTCERCGCIIDNTDAGQYREVHRTHHRNLSFKVWLLERFVIDHIGEHQHAAEEFSRWIESLGTE